MSQRKKLTWGLAALALLLAVGALIDAAVSTSSLIPKPPSGYSFKRADQLSGLNQRETYWWIACAFALGAAALSATPRDSTRRRRRRYFANVGTVGLLATLGGLGVGIALNYAFGLEGIGARPVLLGIGLMIAAALASFVLALAPVSDEEREGEEQEPDPHRTPPALQSRGIPLPRLDFGEGAERPEAGAATRPAELRPTSSRVSWGISGIALALAGISCIVTLIWGSTVDDCGTDAGSLGNVALALAVIAAVAGLLALAWRRWMVTLICLVVPSMALFGVFITHLCE
jgi:hypothetical protein